jgi:hypothetical protein
MASRILLVNFTQNEADKLKSVPLTFDRGYLSDVESQSVPANSKLIEEHLKYYFPLSIYEYKAIFFNLNNDPEIKKEFSSKVQPYPRGKTMELYQYYTKKNGIIVGFLGDYKYSHLVNLGMWGITLRPVSDKDITPIFDQKDDTSFKKTLKSFLPAILMPTKHYIYMEGEYYKENAMDFGLKIAYKNLGSRILGCYHNARPAWYDEDAPSFILLPRFKNNTEVIMPMLKEIAKIETKLLPEIYEPDWIDSEKYYPKEVGYFDEKISAIIEKAKEQIGGLAKAKKDSMDKYERLRGILCQTGDKLKISVIDVLRNILKLNVEDIDEKKAGCAVKDEDIVIHLDGRKILAEIKGDSSKYPSSSHITQVWKHLHRCEDKSIKEGALILNYDWKTEPIDRNLAYTGDSEKELEGVIFIDTRTLFNLALAVIDYGMPTQDAVSILFQTGRVEFSLKDYPKNKTE